MIALLPTLATAGLIAYYFLILKPKQDEKAEEKRKSRPDQAADSRQYDEIIDDYPTYHRQVK
jgi:hypothetical protein